MSEKRDLYEIGQVPPVGHVPAEMYAQVIRPERFGEPTKAFKVEKVPVPEIAPDEVLVCVMAAGVNYNNVWAALGVPIDVVKVHAKGGDTTGFHIGGSDASGVVYKVGSDVKNLKVGDEVVVHCGIWDRNDPVVKSGTDPMFAPSFQIWGYETNWGSFAQFTKVQAHQCLPKAKHLSWEAAAAYMLVGATAYRMLTAWPPHDVKANDVVLVWGATGGVGSMAMQIAKALGAIPVGVVSGDDKFEFAKKLGAKGCINRKKFDHWGMLPHWKDTAAYDKWAAGARAFGKALWDVLGERRSPRIVVEHPGEDTVPTSIFVCDTGGMVVICAGHDRLQRRRRPALPLDAAEALPGLALRERRAGEGPERPGPRGQGRSLPRRDLHLRPDRSHPPAHARQQAPRRQHGVSGGRAEAGHEGAAALIRPTHPPVSVE